MIQVQQDRGFPAGRVVGRLGRLPCSGQHAPEVYGGIRESEAAEMLKAFFRDRR